MTNHQDFRKKLVAMVEDAGNELYESAENMVPDNNLPFRSFSVAIDFVVNGETDFIPVIRTEVENFSTKITEALTKKESPKEVIESLKYGDYIAVEHPDYADPLRNVIRTTVGYVHSMDANHLNLIESEGHSEFIDSRHIQILISDIKRIRKL